MTFGRRFIARGVPSRQPLIETLTAALPEVEWCIDRAGDAIGNLVSALYLQGDDDGAVHLEEDIELTTDFRRKVERAIEPHAGEVIQMFSMRPKKDLTEGSRWDRRFMMTQAFYVPPGMATDMADWIDAWDPDHGWLNYDRIKDPGGIDMAIDQYLRRIRRPYWLHVPSLVQHLEAPSTLGPRSTKRQSPTYVP